MRLIIAALLLCLAVPTYVAAKPAPYRTDTFAGDRWLMVAQLGSDVSRAARCPAPFTPDCRRVHVIKKAPKAKKPKARIAPGTVAVPLLVVPAPVLDEEQAAAYRVIAELLAAGKVYVRPLPEPVTIPPVRLTPLGGLAREIDRALSPTLNGYLDYLLQPVGNCRELGTLDPRVRQIVQDAARHFNGTALATSCYRSAVYNRQVYARMGRRPTKSLHIARKAIDFKIAGVSKFALAKWVRRHKLAGGVGLYCNSIVHVDVGRRRDWNWCGGRKRVARA